MAEGQASKKQTPTLEGTFPIDSCKQNQQQQQRASSPTGEYDSGGMIHNMNIYIYNYIYIFRGMLCTCRMYNLCFKKPPLENPGGSRFGGGQICHGC
jgi:hypothetical protein